ncbi:hypothetical protein BPO_1491 [Bergeyella porcorum]|uniref:Uncharacterized protein n=1 Tax=Bergeyella porcorum TaxID=1735111 RepID=A0AAU0F2V7_9FLAO
MPVELLQKYMRESGFSFLKGLVWEALHPYQNHKGAKQQLGDYRKMPDGSHQIHAECHFAATAFFLRPNARVGSSHRL